MKSVRCAIYTRKSTEDGLEQDFNSLDAQREACAAYVFSQAGEGWKLLAQRYDDGGLSGGTLERPALQRLLMDVKAGRIDIIVVYKVDRLTRSLTDFSKLVEVFDGAETSFVSVTQLFNTTTSMGRLTLNMLLSFAQFEREVTAERIRDKITASKARGMWMGGIPPLGYRPDGRSLAIVEEHAAIVRDIYARYLALGNVRLVTEALARDQIIAPSRITTGGRSYGGRPFGRGQLYFLLRNPVYAGNIPHKDKIYPGNHPAIIDRATWDTVQEQLARQTQGVRTTRKANASLLSGLLFDASGERFIAVHTNKGNKRYRYYVGKAKHHRLPSSSPLPRLPATGIEQVVRRELAGLFSDPLEIIRLFKLDLAPSMLEGLAEGCTDLCARLGKAGAALPAKLVRRVTIHPERLQITLDAEGVLALPGLAGVTVGTSVFDHDVPVRLARSGRVIRLVDERASTTSRVPSVRLTELLAKAHSWWRELAAGECDIAALSRREGLNDSYMTRIVRLAFLSPAVTEAILAGTQRSCIDARALLATDAVMPDWNEQARVMLGQRETRIS